MSKTALIDLTGQRFGRLTVIGKGEPYISPAGHREPRWTTRCDCGSVADRRSSHLRSGRSTNCGCAPRRRVSGRASQFRIAIPSYRGAHQRVVRRRGRAATHRCRDCGGPASDWAYDHDDPNAIVGVADAWNSGLREYSADPDHYIPLCKPCHRRFDNTKE